MPIITPPPLQEPFDKEEGVSNPWKQWSQSVYIVANTVEQSGITANRPSHKFIGQQFFDTTLGEPVFSNGTAWITIGGSGGGDALTANPLSQFAATTSAQLAGVISNETGSGLLVFNDSPTLVTPALGTPSALVGTNISGTASSFTASNVTTNANLTGHITSTGNAAVLGSFTSAQLKAALTNETGSGAAVFAESPALVTPALGTPASGNLANCTFPTLNQDTTGQAADLTGGLGGQIPYQSAANTTAFLANGSSGQVLTSAGTTSAPTWTTNAAGDALTSNPLSQFAATTSLQLKGVLSDETGSGAAVFATSPTLVTPALGTPASGNLANCTFPTLNQSTSGNAATVTTNANLTGHVTSVGNAAVLGSFTSAQLATALTNETGSGSAVFATSPTFVTPVLGTPASGVATNLTGTAASLTAGNVTTNANLTGHITSTGNAAVLGSFTSAQLATALTNETGSGLAVFGTSPTLITPVLGTPASGTLTNCTFPTLNQNTTGQAADLTGGLGAQIPYQSAANTTAFLANGSDGQVLTSSGGTAAPAWETLPSGGDALTANPLSQFAATTSAQLAGVISNETGSGVLVFNTSPTLVTPVLGAATATTLSVSGFIGTAATAAIKIPVGTTGQRPTPATGMLRFNSTTTSFEGYNGSAWTDVTPVPFTATGGTITTDGLYTVHTFTSSGTFTPAIDGEVEYLVVAGGGGGGRETYYGSGGGAGGYLTATGFAVAATGLTVTIGAGGIGNSGGGSPYTGTNGGNSVFSTITAIGGGGGVTQYQAGIVGGSGSGGGGHSASVNVGGAGTAGQGNAGGSFVNTGTQLGGSGGGGAGSAGSGNSGKNGGTGGAGLQSSINGTATYYSAGAGGTKGYPSGANGANGTGWADAANLGHGGGPTTQTNGSSGIVIIRYLT